MLFQKFWVLSLTNICYTKSVNALNFCSLRMLLNKNAYSTVDKCVRSAQTEVKMERWIVHAKKADFNELGKKFQIDPVVARIIRNRDVIGEEEINYYLNGTAKEMHSPHLMKDMEKAVDIIQKKIEEKAKIRIIGDYDIDGISSLYILLSALRSCGAVADGEIPHRIQDGYGINMRIVEEAYEQGVDTLITCDNGIAASAQTAHAKSLGMTVIVTDHHDIPYEEKEGERSFLLPPADAVINPKQAECGYPYKELCGAGVAYKLVQALYERIGRPEEAEAFLEFAAIATVGDVMELLGENRIIVKEGLKRLRKTENIGLRALIEVNGLDYSHINSYHIGFVIGPCLNAGGRLDTAKRGLNLLMAKDKAEADREAGELKALNDSRKEMTKEGTKKAVELIEGSSLKEDKVLVVKLEDCHESLAGIIAGRIREIYHKPVFVLTEAEEGIKGSGRSIEAYSMFEELTKVKEYMDKFGGHPMAAGLSLQADKVDALRQALNQNAALTEEDFIEKKWIDVPMPISYLSKELIESFSVLEPFGKGNEKPVFAEKNLKMLSKKIVGKNENAVKLLLEDARGCRMDAIYFGNAGEFMERTMGKETISVLYYPGINEFRGTETLQIVVTGYQ